MNQHRFHVVISRLPFTLTILALLAIAALVTNTTFQTITHHWLNHTGFAPNDLWYGRIERIFSSALVTSGGIVFWEALFFVIFAVGLYHLKKTGGESLSPTSN